MAVTNLTGYTWVGNATLLSVGSPFAWKSSSTDQLSLNFTSKGNNYTSFGNYYKSGSGLPPISYIGYNSTYAYNYTGGGWQYLAYKTILITGGDDVTNTTLITWLEANGTLTPPEPEPTGYEVTFVTNGGTSITNLEDVEELPTPLPTTTKANNIFVGWYYDNLLTQKANAGDELTANVTLYAKWYTPTSWCEDIADAIREKDGTTEPIKHLDFPERILTIASPKAEETKTVTPNFASGNVVVTPTTDKVMTQVTINKDDNLIADNIKKDVTVHGITGSSFIAIELTQAQYDALATKDANTYYLIKG